MSPPLRADEGRYRPGVPPKCPLLVGDSVRQLKNIGLLVEPADGLGVGRAQWGYFGGHLCMAKDGVHRILNRCGVIIVGTHSASYCIATTE